MDAPSIRPNRPVVTRTFIAFYKFTDDRPDGLYKMHMQEKDCIAWDPRELHEFLTSQKVDIEKETDV